VVSEAKLADLDEQVRKGQLTLADLEQLGDEGGEEGLPTCFLCSMQPPSQKMSRSISFPFQPRRKNWRQEC